MFDSQRTGERDMLNCGLRYIRLTSTYPSQQGWVSSRVPLSATNWEVGIPHYFCRTSSQYAYLCGWPRKLTGTFRLKLSSRFMALVTYMETDLQCGLRRTVQLMALSSGRQTNSRALEFSLIHIRIIALV